VQDDARKALSLREALARPEWETLKKHVLNFYERRFGKEQVGDQSPE
jgi:hypothetical protein